MFVLNHLGFGLGLEFVIAMFTLIAPIFLYNSCTHFCLTLWVSLCPTSRGHFVSGCSHSCIPVIFPTHLARWWWVRKGDILTFWLILNIKKAQMSCYVLPANIHTHSPRRKLLSTSCPTSVAVGFSQCLQVMVLMSFHCILKLCFSLREMPLGRVSQWLPFIPLASSMRQDYLGFIFYFLCGFLE